MDMIDAPYVPIKQRTSKSTFQRELDMKMQERRAKGLTADLTSEDSEGVDGLDSDEEMGRFLSILNQGVDGLDSDEEMGGYS